MRTHLMATGVLPIDTSVRSVSTAVACVRCHRARPHARGPRAARHDLGVGERWQSPSLNARTANLPGQPDWERFVECCVESQPGDEGDRLYQRLAEVEQIEGCVVAVRHDDDVSIGEPTTQLEYHLSRPVGDPLVWTDHGGTVQKVPELSGPAEPRSGVPRGVPMAASHIRLIQRSPVVWTKWDSLERTASLYTPRALM